MAASLHGIADGNEDRHIRQTDNSGLNIKICEQKRLAELHILNK